MDIITPLTITNSNLSSSNVPENDYSEWSSGTTYATGDKVIVIGTTHKVYESLVDGNVGNDPTTDLGTKWLTLSATNRWKAFDQKISEVVENTNTIEYVFTPTNVMGGLACFNLTANNVNVVLNDGTSDVYDRTIDLQETYNVVDWYTYFFEEIISQKEVLFNDIPPYRNATITVTVDNTGGTAEVGQIVLGPLLDLGFTEYGSSVSIQDFSRKERDAFGNPIIVERAFAQRADFEVALNSQEVRRVQTILADFRAKPIVWIGSEDTSFGSIIYGFYNEFNIAIDTPSLSYATIEVEGLT